MRDGDPVPPEGDPATAIAALVAEAPGEDEVFEGRPLIGRSGMELQAALNAIGVKRKQVFLTNSLACRPIKNELARVRGALAKKNEHRAEEGLDPLPDPIEACKPRLEAELSAAHNVIALGGEAYKSFKGGNSGILSVRGRLNPIVDAETGWETKLFPTVHPAFVLRSQRYRQVFQIDIARAFRWFRNQLSWTDPQLVWCPSPMQLRAFLYAPRPFTVYDVETRAAFYGKPKKDKATGLPAPDPVFDPLYDRLTCIGFGDTKVAYVVPFRSVEEAPRKELSPFYTPQGWREILDVIFGWLEDPNHLKVTWNGESYDATVIESESQRLIGRRVTPQNSLDGLLVHRVDEPDLPHGLGFVGPLLTDVHDWKCYDDQTEVLTRRGWVRFDALTKGEGVAQVTQELAISFVPPLAYTEQPFSGEMLRFDTEAMDLLVTLNHRMFMQKGAQRLVVEAQDFPRGSTSFHAGTYWALGLGLDPDFIRLLVATQADGSWAWRRGQPHTETAAYLDFGFSKERKITRLREFLTRLGVGFIEKPTGTVNPRTRFWISEQRIIQKLWDFLGQVKAFGPWVLALSIAERGILVDEVLLWDGSTSRRKRYTSVQRANADYLQIAAVTSGRAARVRSGPNGKNPIFTVALPERATSVPRELPKAAAYEGRIYCLTVPSGLLLVRRNGLVTVSGNSGHAAVTAKTNKALAVYNSIDDCVTAQIITPLIKFAAEQDLLRVLDSDHKMQAICRGMHRVGMPIDQRVRAKRSFELTNESKKWRAEVLARMTAAKLNPLKFNKPKSKKHAEEEAIFNPASADQVRALLFGRWDLPLALNVEKKELFTEKGDRATGDAVLRAYVGDPRLTDDQRLLVHALRLQRRADKTKGSFVDPVQPLWKAESGDTSWTDGSTITEVGGDWGDDEILVPGRCVLHPDGRIHPEWNAGRTNIGRLASKGPNGQNWPEDCKVIVCLDEENERRVARGLEPLVLVGADQDALHLRIIGDLWGIPSLQEAFIGKPRYHRGYKLGPHELFAIILFEDEFLNTPVGTWPTENPEGKWLDNATAMRSVAKTTRYAGAYRGSSQTLFREITSTEDKKTGKLLFMEHYTPERVEELHQGRWLRKEPEWEIAWNRTLEQFGRDRFLTEPILGRKLYCRDQKETEIINGPILLREAAIMHLVTQDFAAAVPSEYAGPGTGLINQCHDSLTACVPRSDAQRVSNIMRECMSRTIPGMSIPFIGKPKTSTNWKEV